jgi:multicomponent K+:H+ antiporter subunit E
VRTVERLLPHPVLSGLLLGAWIVLHDSLNPGRVALGAVLALLIPLYATRVFPERLQAIRWRVVLRLMRHLGVDLVVANLRVVRIVMAPHLRAEPRFIAVPLELESPFGAAVLASLVTMTPGTISVNPDLAERTLWVHGLDVDDPEAVVRHIKERYEKPLRELFG